MIIENKFLFQKKPIEIFESLIVQIEKPIEIEKDISLLFIGSKSNEIIYQIKNALINNKVLNIDDFDIKEKKEGEIEDEEKDNHKNILFLVEYKNIYIGGISYNFNSREGFGLNKYGNSTSFYLGRWKDNMKEGTGFLKIDDNTLYVGSFNQNQFDGFGMLYYKPSQNTFYFGEFENGSFSNGIYCNISKELFYRGRFQNNKKNDKFCTFLEKKNKHLYIGEVVDDIFVKGYLCLYQINEYSRKDENEDVEYVADFDIEKLFYFDKTEENNINFIHIFEFENEFKNKIIESMKKIFEIYYKMRYKVEDIFTNYFNYLETLADDDNHKYLERYNENNERSLEKFFITNYNVYLSQVHELIEETDINEIRKEIEIPEINKYNINE